VSKISKGSADKVEDFITSIEKGEYNFYLFYDHCDQNISENNKKISHSHSYRSSCK